MEISLRHKLAPLVFARIATVPLPEPIRSQVADICDQLRRTAAAISVHTRHELRTVVQVLRDARIDSMLIKGPAVDRDPLRQTNDLDLLIQASDLRRAVDALSAAGYRYVGSDVLASRQQTSPFRGPSWNNQYPFRSPRSPLCVEIHTNLFERDRIRLERLDQLLDHVDRFWDERTWDEELSCYVPSPEATLMLLCIHSATKRSPAHNTYILRHGYDIRRTVADAPDRKRFLDLCRALNVEYYAFTALRLTGLVMQCDTCLHLARGLRPELTRREQILASLHLRCYRGLGRASLWYRYLYALFMPFAIAGSPQKAIRWYRQLVLPPRWRQRVEFSLRDRSLPILLSYLYGPFVRVFRLFAGRRDGE